jgi:O-antigen ligase
MTLSGTRGLWAAVVAPVALLVLLYAKKVGTQVLRRTYWPIALFLLFILVSPLAQKAAVLLFHAKNNYGNFIERASSIYDLSEQSNAGRLHIWKDTLIADVANPFLGVGYGNFLITLSSHDTGMSAGGDATYSQLAGAKDAVYNLPSQYITAHNLYLDVLTETGLFGLLLFLFFFGDVLVECWKFLKEHVLYYQDGLVHFVAASGVCFCWLLAYSLFDGTLMNDRVLSYFFIVLALVGVTMRLYNEGERG